MTVTSYDPGRSRRRSPEKEHRSEGTDRPQYIQRQQFNTVQLFLINLGTKIIETALAQERHKSEGQESSDPIFRAT